ncbi:MAG: Phosphoethanolamine transferase EptA, partial [Pseudomonadota bacterium]
LNAGLKLGPMTSKSHRTSGSQRSAWHPAWLAVVGSLWLASVGNIALWMQVHQLPEVSGLRGFAFAMGFGAIITAALTLVLSLFNWRWLLKPVLTVFSLNRC